MAITFRCSCGKQSDLPESFLGKRVRCNFCNALSIVADQAADQAEHPELDWETHVAESLLVGPAAGRSSVGVLDAEHAVSEPSLFEPAPSGEMPVASEGVDEPPVNPESTRVANPKEYKVLTQRDKWFGGKFSPERLEEALNHFAGHGWAVRSMASGSIGGFGANREELVVLLERG